MAKLLKQIQVAVELGGEKLNQLASVSGMTASQFQQSFKEDAVQALSAFIEGLNDTERNGKSAIVILNEMGLNEVRLSNTILSLANANGVMSEAIKLSNESWIENSALTKEAEQRYATVESQLAMLKNSVNDIAIELGQALLPVIIDLVEMAKPIVEKIKEWATAYKNLDEESQKSTLKMIAFVAALGPMISVAGKVVSSVGSMVSGFGKVATAIGNAGGIAKIFSTAMSALTGPVGIAIGVITALVAAFVHLYNTNDEFKETVQNAWKKIQEAIQKVWKTLEPIFQKIMQIFQNLWDAIEPLVEILGTVLLNIIVEQVEMWALLMEQLSPVLDLLVSAVGFLVDVIGAITSVFSESIPEIERFDDTVSEATREAVGSFMDLEEQATMSLNQMAWSGSTVTEEMKNNMISTINEMKEQIVSKIEEQRNETTQILTEQLATLTTISEEEKQKIITDANAGFDEKQRITEEGSAKINEILTNASQQNRAITQEEANEINRIKSEMTNTAVAVMSENEAEQAAILERMKANASDLSAQQAAEVVKNSIEQKEKTIEAANQEYDERMKAAARLRAVGTEEANKAANEIIASAEKQKNDTIAKAEEMHQKVVTEAQNQADEHINKVDWETGEIKSNWEVFWSDLGTNISNGWNSITKSFSNGVENIKTSWNTGIDNIKQGASQKWLEITQGVTEFKNNTVTKISELGQGIQEKWRTIKRKYSGNLE